MGAMFCPKCKALMTLEELDKKKFWFCSDCHYAISSDKIKGKISSSEKIIPKEIVKEGAVIDKNTFANYDFVCPKCKYTKAQIIDVGILYSDEDNLILLKCGKCGHSQRIGEKVC